MPDLSKSFHDDMMSDMPQRAEEFVREMGTEGGVMPSTEEDVAKLEAMFAASCAELPKGKKRDRLEAFGAEIMRLLRKRIDAA